MKNLTLLIALISLNVSAQDCSCADNFKWIKTTFEQNDAGFQFAVDQKGAAEYQKHNLIFEEKVKNITDVNTCSGVLLDWLRFFRKGHISVSALEQPSQVVAVNTNKWEEFSIDEKKFKKQLSKATDATFEGIWQMAPYTVGITKTETGYIGFIIDAPGTNWKKNQVKLRINADKTKPGNSGTLYLRDYSAYQVDKVQLIGNNLLSFGAFSMQRINSPFKDSKQVQDFIVLSQTKTPLMQEIEPNTLVFRVPSFDPSYKPAIDSILKVYHQKIISTQNLVIDIRNNGGGSDSSYNEIIPYLYTNPIRIVSVEMLSTKLNNQRMEGFLSEPGITENDVKEINEALKKLNDNLGKFVNMNGKRVFTQTMDNVYEYPKNVAILTNYNNGSTAEQFLLAAKQSKKTKLFGTTTMGVLDISNMHFVNSPCGNIELGYCLSKSYRIPEMAIDGKGIQPDYYLDDTIQDQEWVDFVINSFNQNKQSN